MTEPAHPANDFSIRRAHISPAVFPEVVVAIPAQNEAQDIAACLHAIAVQEASPGALLVGRIGVVCLVNNSCDATYDVACDQAARDALPIRVYEVSMASHAANAGGARRVAMNLSGRWLEEGGCTDGLIFTTDADSLPAPDWIVAARRSLSRGAHAVAGRIDLHPQDALALPPHVRARGALEAQYDALLTEIFARLDPRLHDPWPCHATEAGANLAVTLRAYRAIGGLPRLACGEDRALCAALEHAGLHVRHDLAPRVSTSGRLVGRAAGGVADTIRLRCEQPDAPCDSYLEPAWNARFRAFWRGRLRCAFAQGGSVAATRLFGGIEELQAARGFDEFWLALENTDPRLARIPLRPADLPDQIAMAEVMARRLRGPDHLQPETGRADNPHFVPAE